MTVRRLAALAAALVMALTACGDDAGGVGVVDAWSRGGQPGATSAVYLTLESADGDTLTGVVVDASIASGAQLHQTVVTDISDDMSDDMSQGMTMEPLDELELPAGGPVAFEPGGYHIMLVDLAGTLAVGSTFEITLQFDQADDLTVEVEVMNDAP